MPPRNPDLTPEQRLEHRRSYNREYYKKNKEKWNINTQRLTDDLGTPQSGVYILRNPVNEKFYVGITHNLHLRLNRHRSDPNSALRKCKDVAINDWTAEMYIPLPSILTNKVLNDIERLVIQTMGVTNCINTNNTDAINSEINRGGVKGRLDQIKPLLAPDIWARVLEMFNAIFPEQKKETV